MTERLFQQPAPAAPSAPARPPVRMFLHSAFHNDTRVLREAAALVEAGYPVDIVAAADPLRAEPLPRREVVEGAAVVRVDRDSRTARAARALARLVRARPEAAPSATGAAGSPAVGPSPAGPGASPAKPRRTLSSLAYTTATRAVKTLDYVRFVRSALGHVHTGGAAIFVAHDLITLPVGWLAKRSLGGALVYDSHELYSEHDAGRLGGKLTRWRWRALESRLIGQADHVITVNDSIADELARRYGVARPTVIRNVPRRPPASAHGIDLRVRLDIPPEHRLVLYLGGLTRNRGLEQLIASAARVPRCTVAIVGPSAPAYAPTLAALIERESLTDRVHVLPPVPPEDVIPTARSADVGVSFIQNVGLNNFYSLPNKLFEYIQAGLPVVTSDFPELERVVLGRGVGITCDPGDPEAIARAIATLLDDAELRARLSANARAAATELSWEAERDRYRTLFDDLARRLARG